MKQTTLGHVAVGFSSEGEERKRHMALGLLPLGCSLSARWCFDWALTGMAQG